MLFDNNDWLVGFNTFDFIKNLQWNDMEKEIKTTPVKFFRCQDEKNLKEKLFSCMENNMFITESLHKYQGIIHLMMAMIKIRCNMAIMQGEEEAIKILNFKIKVFINSFTDEYFSKQTQFQEYTVN